MIKFAMHQILSQKSNGLPIRAVKWYKFWTLNCLKWRENKWTDLQSTVIWLGILLGMLFGSLFMEPLAEKSWRPYMVGLTLFRTKPAAISFIVSDDGSWRALTDNFFPNGTALTHPMLTSFPADNDKDAHEDRELCWLYPGQLRDTTHGTRHTGHETRQDLLHKIWLRAGNSPSQIMIPRS